MFEENIRKYESRFSTESVGRISSILDKKKLFILKGMLQLRINFFYEYFIIFHLNVSLYIFLHKKCPKLLIWRKLLI